jgi:hypothetical protein
MITLHKNGQKYTSLPSGTKINAQHYFLEDDMRLVPAQNHQIGDDVGPWEVGLWFAKADTLPAPAPQPRRGTILRTNASALTHKPAHGGYTPLTLSMLQRLAASLPTTSVAHQKAAVTANALGFDDWDGDHSHSNKAQAVPEKALTYDDGKPALAHLPWDGIDALAKVQAFGHKRYGDFYNYKKGMEVSRNASCAIRHIRDFMKGLDRDAESGEHPLAHAAVRLLFVLQNIADGKAIDDRYSKRAAK